MKVKEVEELLQITRANIRFYETEGLLRPERSENGYRSYSKEDVEQLKKIILFRKLGISIPDIKKIFDEEETISAVISQNILTLNHQLSEIKGAIDVCKRIEKDADSNSSFDFEKYWNIVEQEELAGRDFYDNLKDYIEFEGNTFKSIWSSVFFYDLDGSVKKRGWLIALLIILGICVIRGLAYQFVWKWGSFWYGFAYPFVLFLVISSITSPMYILNYIYNEKELIEEPPKVKKRKIPLSGLWKLLGLIMYFILLLIGIPIFWEKIIYNNVMGAETNYIITGSPFILYIIVALYLFCLTIWLYSSHGLFGNAVTKEKGFQPHLPERVKKKVMAVSVAIFIITVIVYGTWYDCITEEGITKRHFFWTKSYSWEDVGYYMLSANFDGTLQYTIIMKDGTPISLMGGISSSNLDKKEYPEGEDDFILQLTEQFAKQGILIKVNSWEKLHKKLSYDYWDEYVDEIRAIAE
ncbi:MerR family transcriptional regulator [Konateibacter massiliensis]|uniref:MerR family transcriptional regulator n=1 Tax=Konateibacter massiliensis TaxID=2002841 RepID=UPI000C1519F5|nr:MerR family transcriptional regulator [Konateibacter massiliensis]